MIFVFVFFAVVILAHTLCRNMTAKNICLLISSLIFYSWASLGFTAILLFETVTCWFFALRIDRSSGKARRGLLAACVAILLAILCVFKYTGFLLENVRFFTGFPQTIPNIVLPLGISFYTFQLISYVADVYRGDVTPQRKFWKLLLYASLFHQCVAGPIVRYGDIAEELEERWVTTGRISQGITRFTVGLAKKAVLANSCAVVADAFFTGDAAALASRPAAGLWLSGLAFMLQIYLDFSAYSDMALGMGLMCGFHYPENFDYPYIASSVTDFWRRWHISLSSFFRDYVYIPLGGNRRGKGRQALNLLIVWLLTGLWHGASWNYILWGLYFFVFLAAEKFILGGRLEKIPAFVRRIALLPVIYFCWIIFKFEDFTALWTVVKGLFCLNGNAASNLAAELTFKANWILLLVSAIACTPLCKAAAGRLKERASGNTAAFWLYSALEVIHPAALLLLSAMALAGDSYNPFIYWMF